MCVGRGEGVRIKGKGCGVNGGRGGGVKLRTEGDVGGEECVCKRCRVEVPLGATPAPEALLLLLCSCELLKREKHVFV